jgi:AraC family transcriptional regulator
MTVTLSFHADAYQPGTRQRPHWHDELHLSLVLSGRVAETVGTVTEYAGALSVVAKDAGVVHANDFGAAGAKLARLILPSGTIGSLIDQPSRSPGWRWTHDADVARAFLRLVHRANGGVSSFKVGDPDLLDLLAAFTARPAPLTRGRPPAWLEQTMEDLRASWNPGLTVADVARRAGVHPVYLARCVRRWFGTGVGEEIRRLRIRSAAAAVAEKGRTVSNVAHASGFADEPHLCREFRRTVGTTPGRYRALVKDLDYDRRGRP